MGPQVFRVRDFGSALAGYAMFGVGYIGLHDLCGGALARTGRGGGAITWFYALLGLAVVLSSRIWAGLLDRSRGGQALALLNGLLGVATVLPALTGSWPVALASGLLFGGVFLSVVASTTALVQHNLPPSQWAAGISAFTIVFCCRADCRAHSGGVDCRWPSGLARGLVFSAGALWLARCWHGASAPYAGCRS